MVAKNRNSIQCGRVKIDFIAKNEIANTPVYEINTLRGRMLVSTPEATALDLVGYQQHCGGLDHVATILSELAEKINPNKLVLAAAYVPMPWVQRLGYLLNLVGTKKKTNRLEKLIEKEAPKTTPLLPGTSVHKCSTDSNFRVTINTEVESDL